MTWFWVLLLVVAIGLAIAAFVLALRKKQTSVTITQQTLAAGGGIPLAYDSFTDLFVSTPASINLIPANSAKIGSSIKIDTVVSALNPDNFTFMRFRCGLEGNPSAFFNLQSDNTDQPRQFRMQCTITFTSLQTVSVFAELTIFVLNHYAQPPDNLDMYFPTQNAFLINSLPFDSTIDQHLSFEIAAGDYVSPTALFFDAVYNK
jgi:hypothetical protein